MDRKIYALLEDSRIFKMSKNKQELVDYYLSFTPGERKGMVLAERVKTEKGVFDTYSVAGLLSLFMLAVLMLSLLTGCNVIAPKKELKIISWNYKVSDESSSLYPNAKKYLIEGTAKNTGNQTLNLAEVIAKFWDKAGNYLDCAFDHAYDLAPDTTWKFVITYWDWDGEVSKITVEAGSVY